jgi:hypothetical protein
VVVHEIGLTTQRVNVGNLSIVAHVRGIGHCPTKLAAADSHTTNHSINWQINQWIKVVTKLVTNHVLAIHIATKAVLIVTSNSPTTVQTHLATCDLGSQKHKAMRIELRLNKTGLCTTLFETV